MSSILTMLYESGIDPLVAMKIVGHTDYQTTANIYTHIKEEMLKKATVDLEGVFKKRAGKEGYSPVSLKAFQHLNNPILYNDLGKTHGLKVEEGVGMIILSTILVVLLFRVVLLTYPELHLWGRWIDQHISEEKHDSAV